MLNLSSSDYATIVETETLQQHLDDPNWLVFDCRFDLTDFSFGRNAYAQSHIPGAIYADLNQDLSGPITATTGRHPLPPEDDFAQRCSSWGIEAGKQVVVYDQAGGGFAVRLWWLLNYYGHRSVAVLNGGYAKWVAEARPVDDLLVVRQPGVFKPAINRRMVVDAKDVNRLRLDPQYLLIDARAETRFKGLEELIDPVAGHIPGARNRFHGENLSPDGTLLDAATLRRQFDALRGDIAASNMVVYCGSGVTSCHHILAMQHAGMGLPRLFPGSWSEWIRDPERPVETGG